MESVTSDLECLHTFVESDNAVHTPPPPSPPPPTSLGAPAPRHRVRCLPPLQVHTAVFFGEGEGALLTASWTGEVQAWDLARKLKKHSWPYAHFGHDSAVCAIALCGALVCTAAHDLTLRIARCLPDGHEPVVVEERPDSELVNDMDAPLVPPEVEAEFAWKGFGDAGTATASAAFARMDRKGSASQLEEGHGFHFSSVLPSRAPLSRKPAIESSGTHIYAEARSAVAAAPPHRAASLPHRHSLSAARGCEPQRPVAHRSGRVAGEG